MCNGLYKDNQVIKIKDKRQKTKEKCVERRALSVEKDIEPGSLNFEHGTWNMEQKTIV
jgi:hypothetical protein